MATPHRLCVRVFSSSPIPGRLRSGNRFLEPADSALGAQAFGQRQRLLSVIRAVGFDEQPGIGPITSRAACTRPGSSRGTRSFAIPGSRLAARASETRPYVETGLPAGWRGLTVNRRVGGLFVCGIWTLVVIPLGVIVLAGAVGSAMRSRWR
jgi:hypothetical protein